MLSICSFFKDQLTIECFGKYEKFEAFFGTQLSTAIRRRIDGFAEAKASGQRGFSTTILTVEM